MTISQHYTPWDPVQEIKLLLPQREFLMTMWNAGCVPFIGPANVVGGTSDGRDVLLAHRGMLRKWELILYEHDAIVREVFTNNLKITTECALAWLKGDSLANVDSHLAPCVIERP